MSWLGSTSRSVVAGTLAADETWVVQHTAPTSLRIAKLAAYLDGAGAGAGNQKIRAVVYADSAGAPGALLGYGDEVTVTDGQSAKWVDLPLIVRNPEGIEVLAGSFWMGVQGGADTNNIRIYGEAAGGVGRRHADAYADGPVDPFGAGTSVTERLALFASYFTDWLPPTAGVTEEQLARLPFELTQKVFGARGSSPTGIRGDAGWYGTITDPEVGAFAIVKAGSNMEQFLGERIRIRVRAGRGSRSVFVYVHSMTDDLGDPDIEIALSRRAFLEIGSLSATMVPVEIELAPPEAEE